VTALRITRVDEIGAVTGEASANRTGSRFGVYGTDLGIPWDNGRGEILVAFGDTYGTRWGGHGSGPADADWRCNVLAVSTTADLAGGMALDALVTRPDGTAEQFLPRDRAARRENTVIPTSGITAAGVDYVHYMSVRDWGRPGHWRTNYAGVAVSDDHGRSWRKPESARWRNRRARDHPFQMGAFVAGAEHVYLLGTPNGRFGPASLARVEPRHVSDVDAYECWTGRDWRGGDLSAAAPVFTGPVGELSVRHNGFLDAWLAVYLDEGRAAIVLRTARELTGPWSEPVTVVSGADHPGLYGGYLHPWACDGPELYFTMSRWGPYHVTLMRAALATDG
jgi:D-arabinan endo alpha-(1,5)-arabinofuranosidase